MGKRKINHDGQSKSNPDTEKDKIYVFVKRDLKEYFGESILIVFSVLLALFVTESINKLHERQKTKILLKSIVNELISNKKAIQEMQVYNLQVLSRIDSALKDKKFQRKIVSNDEFHITMIAPNGVLYRFLDNVAWTVAKNNDIMAKLDIESLSVLTYIYEDQDRIKKMEDEVGRVFIDRSSRDSRQVRATLILIRDNYHAWAVDRIPGLLSQIDKVLKKIESE
ncbi:MAG TPA: hypothetical protein VFE71_05815 [Bacteroidales bacterium]|nr:hypothetical protein [Bacteroidales bacterium]